MDILIILQKMLQGTFFFNLFIFREGKGGRKRGKEISIGWLSHTPNWGLGPQFRDVP